MRGTARDALVVGGRGELPHVLAERLGKLGHRVTRLQPDDVPTPLATDLLVHLDTRSVTPRTGELEQALPRHGLLSI